MGEGFEQLGTDGVDAIPTRTRAVEFPDSAIDELRRNVNQFVDDLVKETERVANRNRADHASPQHVRMAVDNLNGRGRRGLEDFLGAIGGAIIGGGVSAYIALVVDGQYPALGVAATAILLVVGTSLLVYQFAKR